MYNSRIRPIAYVALLAAGSCAPSGPVAPGASAEPAPPPSGPCKAASDLRARARLLFTQGKLVRTTRVLGESAKMCGEGAHEAWDIEIAALTELGDDSGAGALLGKILEAKDAPTAAKRAAEAAKKDLERIGPGSSGTLEQRATSMKLLAEADDLASRSGDRAAVGASIDKYVASWEAWRVHGYPLVDAGFAAQSISDAPRARRLFERAFGALHPPVRLEDEHGLFGRAGAVQVFPDGRSMAIVHPGHPSEAYIKTISIVDTRTLRTRVRLQGHTDAVYALAISPDGAVLGTGSQDRTARLWDTTTGDLLHVLGGHGLYVESLSFSPDGKRVATGSFRESRLWDVSTGKQIAQLRGTVAVAFSPDGKVLATSTENKSIALWDGTTGALLRELPAGVGWVRNVAFSPDGSRLAAAGYDHVWMWDTSNDSRLVSYKPKSSVFEIHFSPDGTRLVAEADGNMPLWDTKTGKLLGTLEGRHVAFSSDGKVVAVGAAEKVRLQDAATGSVARTVSGGRGFFLPNGKLVTVPFQGALQTWDPGSGALLATGMEENADQVLSVAFSPDGKHLAVGQKDGTVRRWDLASGALLESWEPHAGAVNTVAYSPDGALFASGSADKTVRLRDTKTGAIVKTLSDHPMGLISLAFSPDGKLLATSARDAVRVFDVATGVRKHALDLLQDSASTVAFSPDGKFVASGSGPKVWHWNLVNGAVTKPMEGHRGQVTVVAYSPDGTMMASVAQDATLRLWDEATGKLRKTIELKRWGTTAISFTPEGKQVAVAADVISFWDVETGARVGTLSGHVGSASSLSFSADGKRMASGGAHGSTLLFGAGGARIGAFHAIAGEDAGYFVDLAGHVDFTGSRACAARSRLTCVFGAQRAPFEVCEDVVRVRGLYAKVLAKEALEEPIDADLEPLACAAKGAAAH